MRVLTSDQTHRTPGGIPRGVVCACCGRLPAAGQGLTLVAEGDELTGRDLRAGALRDLHGAEAGAGELDRCATRDLVAVRALDADGEQQLAVAR